MNVKRGRGHPASGPQFQHDIDYAGLPRDVEEEEQAAALGLEAPSSTPVEGPFEVTLTRALKSKLANMARDEGVDLEQLVQELLAESVTLRAWEIIERKNAMRGASDGSSQQGAGRPFQPNGPRRPGGNSYAGQQQQGGRRPPPGGIGNAWMEDKAAFLEYVRNQEKRRR